MLSEDHVIGKLSDERFASMSAKYDAEQQMLRQEIVTLEAALTADETQAGNIARFIAAVRRCPDIEELTPAIVHEFIEKVIVHEPEGKRKNRTQCVEIFFNGVGPIDTNRLLSRSSS